MNTNQLVTDRFSNAESEALYKSQWRAEPSLAEQYRAGRQCGGCTYFAPFNADFGLCCGRPSRHFAETVFEHFTCPSQVNEGWGPHSFCSDPEFMCRCHGEPVYESIASVLAVVGDDTRQADLEEHLRVLREYVESCAVRGPRT